jgi:hypothetical protein
MRRFILKTLVYLSPVLVLIGALEYIMYLNKETVLINAVIDSQLNSKNELYYFKDFFDNSPYSYKVKMAERNNARILVVGQSTVLQFNDEMFAPLQHSFYNLGFSIHNIYGLQSILGMIEKKKICRPDLMIIGIDADLIKKRLYENDYLDEQTLNFDPAEYIRYHFAGMQILLKQLVSSHSLAFIPHSNLGYGQSGMRGEGFRRDGSLHYAGIISNYLKHPTYVDAGGYKAMLKNKDYIFTSPYELDSTKVRVLSDCLKGLKALGVQVVLFFPPISNDFYSFFASDTKFNNFFNTYLALQDTFEAKHFDVIRFTTPKRFGLTDNYMLDGIHPGEVFVGKLWHNFIVSKPRTGIISRIDTAGLNRLTNSGYNIPLSFMRDTLVFKRVRKIR